MRKALDAPAVHDQHRVAAFGPDVLLLPAVEARRVGLGALVSRANPVGEGHHDQRLRIARELAPLRVPGLREDGIALGARKIGDDVEVVDGALDHQRVGHLMAILTPTGEAPAVAREPADEVVERPRALRTDLAPEGGLVLVEAVAHGHAHLAACGLHLRCDPA